MQKRVRPTIRRRNLYPSYVARARALAREWARQYPTIEAIMLTGGVARGYADENSELDLTLFLTPSGYRDWVLRCQSPIPEGDNLVDGTWVDSHLTTIPAEARARWEPLKIWDASFAKVLVDRRGRLAALLRDKARPSISRWNLNSEAVITEWFVELGIGWIDRTDVVAAHHLLNLAFNQFLGLLFGAQSEILPFGKWQFHLSRSLPKLPAHYERRVREWLMIRSFTARDVRRRAKQAMFFIAWWKDTFRHAWLGSQIRDALRTLRKGPLPLTEFEKRFGTTCLRAFPLRAVVKVEKLRRTWAVRLDKVALQRTLRRGTSGMHSYQLDRLRREVGSKSRARRILHAERLIVRREDAGRVPAFGSRSWGECRAVADDI